jgi:hypothetical protein
VHHRYVNAVLETGLCEGIDFKCFSVICALSERVRALDRFVLHKINKMDAEAMELKIQGCKEMHVWMLPQNQCFLCLLVFIVKMSTEITAAHGCSCLLMTT